MNTDKLKPISFVANDDVEYSYNYQTHMACKITESSISYDFEGADIRFLIEAYNESEVFRSELIKQRTNLQIQLEQEREIRKKYGLMLSAALRGDKRSDEPENDGRLDAVRDMVKRVHGLEPVKDNQ